MYAWGRADHTAGGEGCQKRARAACPPSRGLPATMASPRPVPDPEAAKYWGSPCGEKAPAAKPAFRQAPLNKAGRGLVAASGWLTHTRPSNRQGEDHLVRIQLVLLHGVRVFDDLYHVIPKTLGVELLCGNERCSSSGQDPFQLYTAMKTDRLGTPTHGGHRKLSAAPTAFQSQWQGKPRGPQGPPQPCAEGGSCCWQKGCQTLFLFTSGSQILGQDPSSQKRQLTWHSPLPDLHLPTPLLVFHLPHVWGEPA